MGSWLSSRFRLTLGLVAIMLSVFFGAVMVKLVPTGDEAIRASRTKLSESLAIATSVMVSRGELTSLRSIMDFAIKRNPELRSVGIRQADGKLAYASSEHRRLWKPVETGQSTERQIVLNIYKGSRPWGQIELTFYPFFGKSIWSSTYRHPWIQLSAFMGASCFILFAIYVNDLMRSRTSQSELAETD